MTKDENRKRPGRAWSMLRRFTRSRSGIAAVEFALIGPIIIIMILGVFESGRLFWLKASLQYQVDEAGRYAMTHYTREFLSLCDPNQSPAPTSTCADSLVGTVGSPGTVDGEANTRVAQKAHAQIFSGVNWDVIPDTSGSPTFLLIRGVTSFTPLFGLIPGIVMPLQAETRVPMVDFN